MEIFGNPVPKTHGRYHDSWDAVGYLFPWYCFSLDFCPIGIPWVNPYHGNQQSYGKSLPMADALSSNRQGQGHSAWFGLFWFRIWCQNDPPPLLSFPILQPACTRPLFQNHAECPLHLFLRWLYLKIHHFLDYSGSVFRLFGRKSYVHWSSTTNSEWGCPKPCQMPFARFQAFFSRKLAILSAISVQYCLKTTSRLQVDVRFGISMPKNI